MFRLGTAVMAATAALALASCGGGGQSDKEQVESTVRDYYTAFADGDGDKACDQLAEQTQQQFVKAAGAKSCADALQKAAQRPDVRRFTDRLRSAKVLSVEVKGDNATAKVQAIGTTTSVPLVKQGDSWKIEGQIGGKG